MKTYNNPKIEIMVLSNEDILTASVLKGAASGTEMEDVNFSTLIW